MQELTGISNEPRQIHRLVLPDEVEPVEFTMEYRSDQFAWFFSVTWGEFSINNLRLCFDVNCLRQYARVLPFGIGCGTNDGTDPMFVDSFSTEAAKLYLLTADDIDEAGVVAG